MSSPPKATPAHPPATLQTVSELVDAKDLTHTYIIQNLHINYRTLTNRLERPWLFNAVELTQLAKLLDLKPTELFEKVTALAEQHGEFNPNKVSGVHRVGRRRLKPELPTSPS